MVEPVCTSYEVFLAQLVERQTEDLKVLCSIHGEDIHFWLNAPQFIRAPFTSTFWPNPPELIRAPF